MIIEKLLGVLIQVVLFTSERILPALPSGLVDVLNTLFSYMEDGLSIVAFFVDLPFCGRLLSWYLSFFAVIWTIEVVYGVWHKITGNAGSSASAESSTIYYDDQGTPIGGRTSSSSRRSRPRLPRI